MADDTPQQPLDDACHLALDLRLLALGSLDGRYEASQHLSHLALRSLDLEEYAVEHAAHLAFLPLRTPHSLLVRVLLTPSSQLCSMCILPLLHGDGAREAPHFTRWKSWYNDGKGKLPMLEGDTLALHSALGQLQIHRDRRHEGHRGQ